MNGYKKGVDGADFFYDMAAVWALEPDTPASPAPSRPPTSFIDRCLALKHHEIPVTLTLHSGRVWRLRLRAVALSWLSGESTSPARGVVIAQRSVASLEGEAPTVTPPQQAVGVSMLDALGHSLRVNSFVELGTPAGEWVGTIAHRGVDYLELHTRPGLTGSQRVVAIAETAIDFVRFLDPGDSF